MDSTKPKMERKDSLDCVNSFISRVNKKMVMCSKTTMKLACSIVSSILDKKQKLIEKLIEDGLPDDLPILRAYSWKILLNYLPEEPKKWEETLTKKRAEYNSFKQFVEKKLEKEINEKTYKSKDILEQIIKDVYRTNTQIAFFFEPTNKKNVKNKEEFIKMFDRRKNCTFSNVEEIYYDEKENEIHADVLKRILFIYTVFSPEISYHQGMNELLAPIYYCYSYDKTYTEETEENIEADSFWSFHYLMSKVSQSFVSSKDNGLELKSFIFQKCLEYIDDEIAQNLQRMNLKNEYFCYRWFILLFSQEFEINDLLKLWDLVFCQEDKYYYIYFIGIAILIMKKDILVNGEMYDAMQSLQNFMDIDILELIRKTKEINRENKEELDDFILHTRKITDNYPRK